MEIYEQVGKRGGIVDIAKLEELKKRAKKLKYNNSIMKDFHKNKQYLIEMNEKDIYDLLGKTMFLNFNNDVLRLINEWLIDKDEKELENIKNWMRSDYCPFVEEVFRTLNVSSYEDLAKLSLVLDNQMFFLDNAKENGMYQYKLTIYEIPFVIKRKLKQLNLLKSKERMKELSVTITMESTMEFWKSENGAGILSKNDVKKHKVMNELFERYEQNMNRLKGRVNYGLINYNKEFERNEEEWLIKLTKIGKKIYSYQR